MLFHRSPIRDCCNCGNATQVKTPINCRNCAQRHLNREGRVVRVTFLNWIGKKSS